MVSAPVVFHCRIVAGLALVGPEVKFTSSEALPVHRHLSALGHHASRDGVLESSGHVSERKVFRGGRTAVELSCKQGYFIVYAQQRIFKDGIALLADSVDAALCLDKGDRTLRKGKVHHHALVLARGVVQRDAFLAGGFLHHDDVHRAVVTVERNDVLVLLPLGVRTGKQSDVAHPLSVLVNLEFYFALVHLLLDGVADAPSHLFGNLGILHLQGVKFFLRRLSVARHFRFFVRNLVRRVLLHHVRILRVEAGFSILLSCFIGGHAVGKLAPESLVYVVATAVEHHHLRRRVLVCVAKEGAELLSRHAVVKAVFPVQKSLVGFLEPGNIVHDFPCHGSVLGLACGKQCLGLLFRPSDNAVERRLRKAHPVVHTAVEHHNLPPSFQMLVQAFPDGCHLHGLVNDAHGVVVLEDVFGKRLERRVLHHLFQGRVVLVGMAYRHHGEVSRIVISVVNGTAAHHAQIHKPVGKRTFLLVSQVRIRHGRLYLAV